MPLRRLLLVGITLSAAALIPAVRGWFMDRPPIGDLVCDDAYSRATLRALQESRIYPGDAAVSCVISTDCDEAIARSRSAAAKVRTYADTLDPGCSRAAYYGWAWYFDREADRGYSYEMTNRKEAELTRTIPKPEQ